MAQVGGDGFVAGLNGRPVFGAPDVHVQGTVWLKLVVQGLNNEREWVHAIVITLLRPEQRANEVLACDQPRGTGLRATCAWCTIRTPYARILLGRGRGLK